MSNPIFRRVDREAARGYATTAPPAAQYGPGPYAGYQHGGGYAPGFQHSMPGQLSAGRVTAQDVMRKAGVLLGIVMVVGIASAVAVWAAPAVALPLWLAGMVGTLALGLVIALRKTVSVPLIVGYAVLEGVFVGAVSMVFESAYQGVVPSAVVATMCVVLAMFVGWRAGYVRVTDRFRRMMGMALVGYLIFALVNVVAALLGVGDGWGFGGNGPLGILFSVIATGLASMTLALDFDSIDRAVRTGAPAKYSWLLAHGLVVTVVWLYVELVRLFSRLR